MEACATCTGAVGFHGTGALLSQPLPPAMQSLINVTEAQHGLWHGGDHALHREAIAPSTLTYSFGFPFHLSYLLNYGDILTSITSLFVTQPVLSA